MKLVPPPGATSALRKGILAILIISCSSFLKLRAGMKDSAPTPYPESSTSTVDGVRYHYRCFVPEEGGAFKGTFLLIHGFASSTFSWRKQFVPLTAKGYRVIAVDIPPFGFSDRSPSIDHSPLANAERLWKLLDREGVEQPYIMGHSMGARVAGAMGALRSEDVRVVFLVDGPFFGSRRKLSLSRVGAFLLDRHLFRWICERSGRRMASSPWLVRRALTFVYGEDPDEGTVQGYMRPLSLPGTGYSLPPYFLERSDQEVGLNALSCKVHLIWGEKDRLFRPRMARRFLERYPYAAEVSLIEGAGHCPMETHPIAFLQALLGGMDTDQSG